jgi:cytoskeletal protein RodZ
MRPTELDPPVNAKVAREERDVRISAVLWFGFWLLVAAVVIHVGLWGLFRLFAAQERSVQRTLAPGVSASLKRTPSMPRLEPLPLAPRSALRASEDARLSSYGWVDRANGVARIPIDRAMELIVQTGVPGGKPLPPNTAEAPVPAAAGAAPR